MAAKCSLVVVVLPVLLPHFHAETVTNMVSFFRIEQVYTERELTYFSFLGGLVSQNYGELKNTGSDTSFNIFHFLEF